MTYAHRIPETSLLYYSIIRLSTDILIKTTLYKKLHEDNKETTCNLNYVHSNALRRIFGSTNAFLS